MNPRGHFRLALLVSLAVHALALALLPWLGVFPMKAPVTRPGPVPMMTLTVVSGAEGLPAVTALESTVAAAPVPAPNLPKPVAAPVLPPEPAAVPTSPVEPLPPAPAPLVAAAIPETTTQIALVQPPARVASENFSEASAVAAAAAPASDSSRGGSSNSDGLSIGPAYRRNPPPRYPAAARRRGEEGIVLLRVLVTERGLPASVKVAASSGSATLDEAAAGAAQRWEFEPARQHGRPVAREVELPIRFVLERRNAH